MKTKKEINDYTLLGPGEKKTKLSNLFGNKKDLIVIHNMGTSCPYCTMWADGFNGVLQHIKDRAAFAVTSPDSPQKQKAFAKKRGWKFRMYSTQGSTFAKDTGFENNNGCTPGVSTFHKDNKGKIYQVGKTGFGPGDHFCSVYHLFRLLGHKADNWEPKFKY